MVKALSLVLLFITPVLAKGSEVQLELTPLVCVSQGNDSCTMQLTVSWHYHEPLCLYISSTPSQPVICQAEAELLSLMLELTDNLQVQLQRPSDLKVLASREVKILKLSPPQENLHKRRLNWGIF
jgi:hypothetical protein